MCLCARMLVLEWKERAFIDKVNSRCCCWFLADLAAILVHQNGAPIWRRHTKLYKVAWNVSANKSETAGHKDPRLGQIVYILVFYNISFSWPLPLDGFQFICLLRDSENDQYIELSTWKARCSSERRSGLAVLHVSRAGNFDYGSAPMIRMPNFPCAQPKG